LLGAVVGLAEGERLVTERERESGSKRERESGSKRERERKKER
jgi:hypothetical protein